MQERLNVYQRAGEPCPRCGRPIRRIVLGARATHFCSWCQRLPAADRAGARASPGDDDRRVGGTGRSARAALDRARRGRRPRADAGRGRTGGPEGADGSNEAGGRATPGGRPGGDGDGEQVDAAAIREPAPVRAGDPRDRHVRDPRRRQRRGRGRRPDRAGRPERCRQDDPAPAGGGSRRARPGHGPSGSAA